MKLKRVKNNAYNCLVRIQSLSISEVLKVAVISDDLKLVLCPLWPVSPLLQSEFDCKQLTVSDVIIPLCRGQFIGEEGRWVED